MLLFPRLNILKINHDIILLWFKFHLHVYLRALQYKNVTFLVSLGF